jgi:hypothetical protein
MNNQQHLQLLYHLIIQLSVLCFHENKNPLTKVKGQYHQAVSDSLVWGWACGYSIGLDHQDIGFSKAFNGYSDTGFQKDKKKLTDIGFIGPDNYRVVFV